mmetsp:Transcript_3624/g.6769  ORF Transcript_3624/g.6769 Transcript_3624/m.6769 type:complete len:138 (+) Transcript_3624:583-996(+)
MFRTIAHRSLEIGNPTCLADDKYLYSQRARAATSTISSLSELVSLLSSETAEVLESESGDTGDTVPDGFVSDTGEPVRDVIPLKENKLLFPFPLATDWIAVVNRGRGVFIYFKEGDWLQSLGCLGSKVLSVVVFVDR